MDPLLVSYREYHFIIVATDYLIKFVEVQALKTSVKIEVTRFAYVYILTRFGISLEMISVNEPQLTNDIWKDLMERLVFKHMFTTMYKLSINGLVEPTNKTLYFMVANKMQIKANASHWDLKDHHGMWIYNSNLKTATGFFPFCLAYGIEALFLIYLQIYEPLYCYKNTVWTSLNKDG